jgi:hypothetical protein
VRLGARRGRVAEPVERPERRVVRLVGIVIIIDLALVGLLLFFLLILPAVRVEPEDGEA